jgi:hypothetical protein
MHMPGFHPKTFAGLMGNASEQGGHIVLIEPIEGASQAVIIEHIRADVCSQEVGHRFVFEELWHQVELAIGKAQSVENHGHGGGSITDHAMLIGFQGIQPLGQAQFLTHSGHNAQMVQTLVPVILSSLHAFSAPFRSEITLSNFSFSVNYPAECGYYQVFLRKSHLEDQIIEWAEPLFKSQLLNSIQHNRNPSSTLQENGQRWTITRDYFSVAIDEV